MKDYRRQDPRFALCGLNCVLCPMHVGGWCPGCGGGEGHQPCAFIRCRRQHGEGEYCFECAEYPCGRLTQAMAYDSFLPHRRMCADLEEARALGLPAYTARLEQKQAALQELLDGYNDGRKKTLYCSAAALLDVEALRAVLKKLRAQLPPEAPVQEKAALAAALLNEQAQRQGVDLKLHKRSKAQKP